LSLKKEYSGLFSPFPARLRWRRQLPDALIYFNVHHLSDGVEQIDSFFDESLASPLLLAQLVV